MNEYFIRRFFIYVIIPRTIWKTFIGSVFLTIANEMDSDLQKQLIATLGTLIILGAVFSMYRAVRVLFADSEQVTKLTK
jgi:hypothetical protein